MTNETVVAAAHRDRTERQRLALQGELNRICYEQLVCFAHAVKVLLCAGRTYRALLAERFDRFEICIVLERPASRLEKAAELADTYGDTNLEELVNAGILAHARGRLRMGTMNRCVESEAVTAKTLGLSGAFARALLEWRRLKRSGEVPPVEFVAYHLAGHWGEVVHEDEWLELGCHLASAFPEGQLTVARGEEIVAEYYGRLVTPELAEEIAAAAIEEVKRASEPAATETSSSCSTEPRVPGSAP